MAEVLLDYWESLDEELVIILEFRREANHCRNSFSGELWSMVISARYERRFLEE